MGKRARLGGEEVRLTPTDRERLDERARDPDAFERDRQEVEAERVIQSRIWAAVMLATNLAVCRSIIAGRPVLARQLDAEALRRALRGAELPPPESYIQTTDEMLDAVAEGGPFEWIEAQ
jgi:hypothetical protein